MLMGKCLNPYCNGIYFLIIEEGEYYVPTFISLNPYCNGIYFLIRRKNSMSMRPRCLNPYCNGIYFLMTIKQNEP